MFFAETPTTPAIPMSDAQPGDIITPLLLNEKYRVLSVHNDGVFTRLNLTWDTDAAAVRPMNPMTSTTGYYKSPVFIHNR